LPYVQRMGFDVLYFPPIHPIGRVNRKGPNNTLEAGPQDHGSPWAIGAEEGGHTSVLPALGTLEDFRRLVQRAGEHGIEVAMDVALQCAPDHPWVREHPGWFRRRPDGSIQYAENPPKKYQDIYPFDFESSDWPALWRALAGIFEFWVGQGVRIFRVDNPHTKPQSFWEWAITEVHKRYPDALFLAEAFTRPKRLRRLGKLGFSQSYSYFTWRNSRKELEDFCNEHFNTDLRFEVRPNLFADRKSVV
jgi:starch synthase (maltosyl-transferring)